MTEEYVQASRKFVRKHVESDGNTEIILFLCRRCRNHVDFSRRCFKTYSSLNLRNRICRSRRIRVWNFACNLVLNNMRVWKTSERQENSVLLTDALEGKSSNDSQPASSDLPTSNTAALVISGVTNSLASDFSTEQPQLHSSNGPNSNMNNPAQRMPYPQSSKNAVGRWNESQNLQNRHDRRFHPYGKNQNAPYNAGAQQMNVGYAGPQQNVMNMSRGGLAPPPPPPPATAPAPLMNMRWGPPDLPAVKLNPG